MLQPMVFFRTDLWWGVIHGFLFRLNQRMMNKVLAFRIRYGMVDIDIALHIRLTDKLTDTASRQVRSRLSTSSICTRHQAAPAHRLLSLSAPPP